MNLDTLEQLARNATPGPWREGTPPPNGTTTVGTHNGLMTAHCFNAQDSGFIAAANPQTILKLIAVARAAQDVVELPRTYMIGGLVSTLEALK